MKAIDIETDDLRYALEIVSLDFVRPVYHSLGLKLHHEETVRGVSRDTLLGRYAPEVSMFDKGRRLETFLSTLEVMVGMRDTRSFAYWVRYIVDREPRNPWTLYERMFGGWASKFRRCGADEVGFSASSRIIEAKFRGMTNIGEATELLARVPKTVLSSWDFARCSEHGLLEIPQGSAYFPLLDAVTLVIGMAAFHEFWQWLVSYCSGRDFEAIGSAAETMAGKLLVPYCPPEKLPQMPKWSDVDFGDQGYRHER